MIEGLRYGKLACLRPSPASAEVYEEFCDILSRCIGKKGFRLISPEVFLQRVGSLNPRPPWVVRVAWRRDRPPGYIAVGRYDNKDRFDFDGYVVGENVGQANNLLEELASADETMMKTTANRNKAKHLDDSRKRKREEVSHLWTAILKWAVPPNLGSAATYYILSNYSISPGSPVPDWSIMFMPVLTFMNLLVLVFLSSLTIYYFVLLVLTESNVRRVE